MKKSKFLQSSKDMLHRSFNPSKCKTSLRLAGSRLKLLRNKKEVQVKQMKREIAQLLDSGQNQTARIRVEHVIREEKMMTAYDLIELYCELIIARLSIIETQKVCPIDLKEAVTSVVFASPRCGDVPELMDIKKQFTEKYGKEFITAAVELRPGCGVSRLVVEKLSAVAPDGQTKIKVLSTIAEEHNVKWDPKSFSESSVSSSDLLHEPSTFGEESKLHTEPSHVEGPVHQVPQSNNRIHDSPSNLTQADNRTSLGPENNQSFQHKARPPVLDDESEQLYHGDRNTPSRDRQRWNMGFKDATSAAQAAAESAELASMAARAAAELSTHDRFVRQYSTESHNSDANVSNDGGRDEYVNSRFSSGQSIENTRSQNEQIGRMHPNSRSPDGRKESTQSASLKSQASIDNNSSNHQVSRGGTTMQRESFKHKAENVREERIAKQPSARSSIDNNSLDHHVQVVEGHSQKNPLKEVSKGGTSMHREKSENVKEERIEKQPSDRSSIDNNLWDHHVSVEEGHSRKNPLKEVSRGGTSMHREKSENVKEERIEKQTSARSSNSHTSISNDVNIFSNSQDQIYKYGADEDTFTGFDQKSRYEEASQTDSRESADVFFDKSESESEHEGFDMGPTYDEPKQPLWGHKPDEHLSTNISSWSPRSGTSRTVESSSSSLFLTRKSSSTDSSDRSIHGSKHDDSGPVVFDQSDAPTSESEEEMNLSRNSRISRDFPSTQSFLEISSEEETFLSKQNQSVGSQFKNKNELSVGSSLKEGPPRFGLKQSSLSKSADTEIEGGLNLEKLTGGFRHKGYNHPPYLKNRFDVSSSSHNENDENTPTIPKSTAQPAVESPRVIEHRKPRTPYLPPESDSDFSEEEESLRKSPDHKQERYAPIIGKNDKNTPTIPKSTAKPAVGSPRVMEHKKPRTPYLQRVMEHKKPRTPYLQPESDSDFSEEEESLRKSPDHKQEKYAPIIGKNAPTIGKSAKTKPSLAASTLIFGPDNSDSDEDRPKESSNRYSHLRGGISRRTKALPSSSGKLNYSKPQHMSQTLDSDDEMDRKATTSTTSETGKRPNSNNMEHSKQPTSRKEASKPIKEKQSQESKVTLKASDVEESSTHQKKSGPSVSRENPKVLDKTSSNKDGSASHVHPKLPDYDNLVQLLQKNRS